MTTLLRFKDLQARGIVDNRVTLRRWIDGQGFPPGKRLGPNTRAWTEDSIDAWVASRDEDRKVVPPRPNPVEQRKAGGA